MENKREVPKWLQSRLDAGLCVRCGAQSSPARLCLKHRRADKLRKRRETHSKPWRAGKRGRPPLMQTEQSVASMLGIESATVTLTSNIPSL